MFDWFFNKRPTYTVPVPYVAPTKEEPTPECVYSIGTTAESTHMTLKIGITTLTMTKTGCQNLIDQLEVFKSQLTDDE